MKKTILSLLALSLLLSACNLPGAALQNPPKRARHEGITPTLTLTPSQTATLAPTETPTITPTPTIMPTIEPMTGVLRAPTNIRARPSKGGSDRLGGMYFNQAVKVIGRNDRANWLWIIYPDSPSGTAWILSSAVDLQGEIGLLPIIIFPETLIPRWPCRRSCRPAMAQRCRIEPPGPDAMLGTAVQLLNVRVGPGLGYLSIGTLPGGTVMSMTGRIEENTWLQIEYPSGPGGRAWVSAELVKLDVGMKRCRSTTCWQPRSPKRLPRPKSRQRPRPTERPFRRLKRPSCRQQRPNCRWARSQPRSTCAAARHLLLKRLAC
jgi:hypothetical protein